METTKKNIYEKLLEVRLSVPYLKKESKGHNNKYAAGSVVIGALRKKMDALGLLLTTEIIKCELKDNIVILDLLYTWINCEVPTEKIAIPWKAIGQKTQIEQSVGSALTYAERYFLVKAFNIPTDDLDPDAYDQKINNICGDYDDVATLTIKKYALSDIVPKDFCGQELVKYGLSFSEFAQQAPALKFIAANGSPQTGESVIKYWATKKSVFDEIVKEMLEILKGSANG